MVYVCLEKDEISGAKGEVLKQASIKDDPNEPNSKNRLLYDDDSLFTIDEIKDDGSMDISCSLPIGFISGYVRLQEEDVIALLEVFVKKLNKLKTAMESLK